MTHMLTILNTVVRAATLVCVACAAQANTGADKEAEKGAEKEAPPSLAVPICAPTTT